MHKTLHVTLHEPIHDLRTLMPCVISISGTRKGNRTCTSMTLLDAKIPRQDGEVVYEFSRACLLIKGGVVV